MATAKSYQLVDLTVESFESWLSQFDDHDLVGECQAEQTCPIAMYVRSETGRTDVKVNPDQIEFNDQFVALPAWAQLFVSQVDRYSEDGDPIYANEARLAARGKFHRSEPEWFNDDDDEDEDWHDQVDELPDYGGRWF